MTDMKRQNTLYADRTPWPIVIGNAYRGNVMIYWLTKWYLMSKKFTYIPVQQTKSFICIKIYILCTTWRPSKKLQWAYQSWHQWGCFRQGTKFLYIRQLLNKMQTKQQQRGIFSRPWVKKSCIGKHVFIFCLTVIHVFVHRLFGIYSLSRGKISVLWLNICTHEKHWF